MSDNIEMLVRVFSNTKLLNSHANQYVIKLNGGDQFAFVSYQSLIAVYDTNTERLALYPDWDRSRTTLRHLASFINDYTSYKYESRKDFEAMASSCSLITFEEGAR